MTLENLVCWLNVETDPTTKTEVKEIYDHIRNTDGTIHNLYQSMSLLPQAIIPADDNYKAVMHGNNGPLEPWLRELISVLVAINANCIYATTNHGENFHDFYGDRLKSNAIIDGLKSKSWTHLIENKKDIALLEYAQLLSQSPELAEQSHIQELRAINITDAEINHCIQITATFAYWVRIINGLGIQLGNEPIGLSRKDQVKQYPSQSR